MIRKLTDIDLRDKTVFLRVDFNVPIDQGKVAESHRIDSALPTIQLILQRAKQVVIASHLGRPDGKVIAKYSLAPVRTSLRTVLLANRSCWRRIVLALTSSASCVTRKIELCSWRI